MKQPFSFVIPRGKWLYGDPLNHGLKNNLLLDPITGKQCCVGVYCSASGVPDEALSGVGAVENIDPQYYPVLKKCIPNWFDDYTGWDEQNDLIYHETAVSSHLYNENDNPYPLREDREAEITRLFSEIGVTVTFVDGTCDPSVSKT